LNAVVNGSTKPHRTGLPHNPGVRELIANKRRYSSPPKRENAMLGFQGWNESGRLPHRDEPGLTQFVTFRLADSFPKSLRSEWAHLWEIEDNLKRRTELENYLDKGHGERHLSNPTVAELVESAFKMFHGNRYELRAWVIMSNHVHVLFKVDRVPMVEIIESWKKHTANKANRVLKRQGAFWAAGYFDTYARSLKHEQTIVRYIENNPVKAKLVVDLEDWTWSSARCRDAYGRLCL
jgi:REP element-mobilizing transposase RayT